MPAWCTSNSSRSLEILDLSETNVTDGAIPYVQAMIEVQTEGRPAEIQRPRSSQDVGQRQGRRAVQQSAPGLTVER